MNDSVSSAVERMYPPAKVVIREVGLRDGLQLVTSPPSTAEKLDWLEAEYQAGIRHFEVGSYVPAATLPQFADVDILVDRVASLGDAFASTLVLNKKGALRALEGRCDEMTFVISASEAHNLRNARRERKQTLVEIADMLAMVKSAERRPAMAVAVAMSFGCSISGKDSVSPHDVLDIAEQCLTAGADIIYVADTVGYATPREIAALVRDVQKIAGEKPVGVHLHDTRGMAIANAAAALDQGARIFDASLAGLGGCPFAPAASGNVVTEDLVFLARGMGFDVPVDIPKLLEARAILTKAMPGEPFAGQIAKAGLPLRF